MKYKKALSKNLDTLKVFFRVMKEKPSMQHHHKENTKLVFHHRLNR